jgi:hypothetical protein
VLTVFRRCVLTLVIVAALGCEESNTTTTIGTPNPLSLTGTWEGLIGTSGSGNALRASWSATQTGNTVTGTITLLKASVNLVFTGTLSGTVSGNQVALNYRIPQGNVPGLPDCTMSGTGPAEASATLIAGALSITYTNCEGFIAQPSTNEPLSLSK